MLHLWHHPIYSHGLDPEATFPRERYDLVRSALGDAERAGRITFHQPTPLPNECLALVHCPNYIHAFLTRTLSLDAERRIGLRPWTSSMVERTLILTHGTISATQHVLIHGGIAGNLGGGTHHAYRDFGSGYCIFNDLALAARIAQRDYGLERILILDLDVHQGDGTAAIFADDPSVRTISFHCGKNFPFRKTTSDRDIVFQEGVGDTSYLRLLENILAEELPQFAPQLILFQAGVDTLATDRLGGLSLTRDGLRHRNHLVFTAATKHRLPLVLTMGGGYGSPIETSVAAHTDLFLQAATFSAATQIDLTPASCLPPPRVHS